MHNVQIFGKNIEQMDGIEFQELMDEFKTSDNEHLRRLYQETFKRYFLHFDTMRYPIIESWNTNAEEVMFAECFVEREIIKLKNKNLL